MIAEIGLFALILALLAAAVLLPLGKLPASRRALLAWAGLAAVLVVLVVWSGRFETVTPPRNPDALIGMAVPSVDLPPLYAGQPRLRTADLKGRVVLVNFFASWCAPCRAEHPLLSVVARSGIAVIGIDYKDQPGAAQTYLAQRGNPYTRVLVDGDGRAGLAFGIDGVPDSYLVDQNGIVRIRAAGPLTEQVLDRDILPLAAKLNRTASAK